MRSPGAHLAIAQVVARNIVPLGGILLLGWNAGSALVLYFVDTLLALAVIGAGAMRKFAPPITDDGWAARANSEVGIVGGGLFIALAVAIPLGMPLVFILAASGISWRSVVDDPALRAGIVWQSIAALWSYVGLYRALRHATVDELRLKRRFALVFLRWMALLIVAYLGVGLMFGRYSAILFVAVYAGLSIWSEVAPDRFLRAMPGGSEDADAGPTPRASAPTATARPRRRRKHR